MAFTFVERKQVCHIKEEVYEDSEIEVDLELVEEDEAPTISVRRSCLEGKIILGGVQPQKTQTQNGISNYFWVFWVFWVFWGFF